MIGLAALGGAALSPLQGLGFGFGYGYGVRLGYHSFKPSKSSQVTGMRLSPNPMTAGTGMGLASAEEMFESKGMPIQGLTQEPTMEKDPNVNVEMVHSPLPGISPRSKNSFKSHEDYVAFVKGLEPYKTQSRRYMLRHQTKVNRKHRSRYY